MSSHYQTNPGSRRGKWYSLFALSLITGVAFQQTATVCAQSAPAKPAPDIIVFTNGDQLTGTLERATGDSFVFKSDIVGEITVTADKIKELHTGGKFVALKNGEKVTRTSKTPGTITYRDNAVTLADTSSSSVIDTVPVKDLSVLIDGATYTKEVTGNPGIFQDWTGGLSGGVTLVESTQTGQTFSAAVNLIRLVPSVMFLPARTRDSINVLETYGKLTQPVIPQTTPPTPDSVAKTNIFHADAEHDKYLTPRLYALVGLSYDHNFAQGLNLQQIYGAGLGYTVIQTPVQEFDVKADVHYERQNFVPPTASTDLIGSSFTELYHRTLPRKILFTESGTFIPAWNDPSIYSAIFEAGLQLPTYRRLSLNLNLQDNYLSNPAFGYKDNSFQFVTGVTYSLK
ncbi:DUF481 domain-containing protein [Tunturibacter empetritectus]|uniref:DUF481 domain-containing protein n=1 Tax=Tunturiibacter lichenicola TaxID=2051959 RepID=A0A7W8N4J7_9BACT|nr:DUF481 domain-containing protein [Edaphobacter lichenicola]MBB5345662.1 hypothetical protein [Edaphobacter lichenicola]